MKQKIKQGPKQGPRGTQRPWAGQEPVEATEEELEEPEVLEEAAAESEPNAEALDPEKEYGPTQDEDGEDSAGFYAGGQPGVLEKRPSIEIFLANGKLQGVIKADASRIPAADRKVFLDKAHKVWELKDILISEYKNYFLKAAAGEKTELIPVLQQKGLIKKIGENTTFWNRVTNSRLVELPDGNVIPLRSFFTDKHGTNKIPVADREIRLEFAKEYLREHPKAAGKEIMEKYVASGKFAGESDSPDGADKKYRERVRQWFNRNPDMKKLRASLPASNGNSG